MCIFQRTTLLPVLEYKQFACETLDFILTCFGFAVVTSEYFCLGVELPDYDVFIGV